MAKFRAVEGVTFDDVLLVPRYSDIHPAEASTASRFTKRIKLNIPFASSAMDTVTESALAVAMAQAGGIGCVHRNLSVDDQQAEVRKVKKFESGMVANPVTVHPDQTLKEALQLRERYSITGIPVVERGTGKLVGMLSNRDVRFATDYTQSVSELMSKDDLVTVPERVSTKEAMSLLHKHRLEKLLVVDKDYRCVGLITVRDIEKASRYPVASKDGEGRLRVAAAVGTADDTRERAEALIAAGVDAIVVDTAHGHSKKVLKTLEMVRGLSGDFDVVGGNVATKEGVRALAEAGADAVKIGIGPGSICTTRIIAGVGVPQVTAVSDAAEYCLEHSIPLIADGGVKYSGDAAKAFAAGASCVMMGSMFAGTEESPGETILYEGRSYKSYRGMGSVGAMARGSADRYFQQDVQENVKLVPEGVEGMVPFKGSIHQVLHQLVGGVRAAMGYVGCKTIEEMHKECEFVRITGASLRESHPHDVRITREAPNYTMKK